MNVHKKARLTAKAREAMVRVVVKNGFSKAEADRGFHTTKKTVAKWVRRFRAEGLAGLQDHSSRPHSLPNQTPPATCDTIEALRCERLTQTRLPALLVSACSRPWNQKKPRQRYERKTAGEIIHIDIKKLGRFNKKGHCITGDRTRQSNQRINGTAPGWEYVHVAIDDHSRVSFSKIYADEKKGSAVAHLKAALNE